MDGGTSASALELKRRRAKPVEFVRRVVALSVLTAGLTTGCFGDPGYTMIYENNTGLRVTVEIVGANAGPPLVRQIEPAGRATSVWVYPSGSGDSRRTLVRAKDSAGVEVFCRKLSYDEAKGNLRWTVDIESGVHQCD